MKLTVRTTDSSPSLPYLDADFTEEIERGAAMLDSVAPGWENSIATEDLMLISNFKCVLGQVSISDLLPKDLKEELGVYASGEPRQGYGSLSYALIRSGAIKKGPGEDKDYAAARYGFYVWENDYSLVEIDQVHFQVKTMPGGYYELDPLTPEATGVVRSLGQRWYWEQLTEQWKVFINERLGRKLEETYQIEKTVEELVASVGAQPQPVFAGV